MTYEQTIDHLYSQLPMFSRIGAAAYKKDLHNTIELCNAIDNPENKFKSIHIAGTNGKGSTANMLAAILQEAGYKTGLYTSPHIKDFRERIRINGEMIDKDFIVDFVERTQKLTEDIQPSFFELTVAMAFDYFAKEEVDIAVIETGLGGRLDSTNIISPILSVITNIGYDHVALLGNTLPEIAFEKAGIIKKNMPVVIGETLPETLPVFTKKANEENAEMHFASKEFIVEYIDSSESLLLCNVRNVATNIVEKLRLDLTGLYQTKNICTVLSSVEVLKQLGFNISESNMHHALENVSAISGLKGRWEVVETKPSLIFDVAHNEDGIKQVLAQLIYSYPTSTYHFVLGFVNDKDVNKVLSLFPQTAKYYFTNAHIPRALPAAELKATASEYLLKGNSFDNVNDAIKDAKMHATPHDVIMVCGSFFIIAEIEKDQISLLELKNSNP
ncbi:MAG: folylpolyglutamate synthase/dihydrofolate synthase family protein [Ferruginibacter sp.]